VVVNGAGCAWPYSMSDSSGNEPPRVPVVMVSHGDGERLVAALQQPHAERARAELSASAMSDGCAICCEPFEPAAAGGGDAAVSAATIMPCLHAFHERCLHSWLRRRATCPLCRAALEGEGEGTASAGPLAAEMRRLRREAERAAALERDREAQVSDWFR
jgi:hypothetical protein